MNIWYRVGLTGSVVMNENADRELNLDMWSYEAGEPGYSVYMTIGHGFENGVRSGRTVRIMLLALSQAYGC